MKRLALFCMFFLPLFAWAQKQYFLPTATPSDEEKDKPMIEVYLPQPLSSEQGADAAGYEDATDGGCDTS